MIALFTCLVLAPDSLKEICKSSYDSKMLNTILHVTIPHLAGRFIPDSTHLALLDGTVFMLIFNSRIPNSP